MKKFFTYPVYFVIFLSIIGLILYGSLLRHHYIGGKSFKSLQEIAVFFAKIPSTVKFIFKNKTVSADVITPISETVYSDKKFFEKKFKSTSQQEELILISRYSGDIGKSIIELRDLNNFDIIHSYLPNIKKIYEKTDLTKEEFINLKAERGINRFYMMHPLITEEGDLIFQSHRGPLVKINFDGEIIWVNDEDIYHHSINTDLDQNIYVPIHKVPLTKKVCEYVGVSECGKKFFLDDAINILNKDGKIIFSKSISEIFIENEMSGRIFSQENFRRDPIHLNDIQPVLTSTQYFEKGDLFLSLRNSSMVVLYRPITNKIVKIIEGSFSYQHDVDILDEKTISIYNNNSFSNYKNLEKLKNNNEIVTYNFETDSFSKKFEDTFKKNKINTPTQGLADFLEDGSVMVEDSDNGRIFYINSEGDIIWEFNNLSSKKQVYNVFWTRMIDKEKSRKLRNIIKEKK